MVTRRRLLISSTGLLIASTGLLLCIASVGHAADPPAERTASVAVTEIGRSIFVANDVDGQAGDAPAKRISVNDDIVFGEDVTTGADAKTVIEFRDGSTFEIGPDAAIRIDAFVFNPEESTSHKTLSVTRGVFRYVSGYVASDQEARIATAHGQLGIRGSIVAGIVDPEVPDFVFLGEGSATFGNGAGNVALQPGNAIAVPSAATPPMSPANMPPAVAAQALQALEKRLPPRSVLANRLPADETWLKRAGAANLVPAAEQQRLATAAASRPPPTARGRSSIAAELGLLAEGNRLNLFRGGQTSRSAEQAAFLDRTAHENPTAAGTLRRFTDNARSLHAAAMSAGTAAVIRGIGRAATAEVMRRVTAASLRANPGAAALINREALRAPEQPGLSKPAAPAGPRMPAQPAAGPEFKRPGPHEPAPRTVREPGLPGPAHREPAGAVPFRAGPTTPGPAPAGNPPFVRRPNPFERQGRPPVGGPPSGDRPPGAG
ncbi:MAG: FecR domain-containing protein, partial [Alphaproteobacteria bacterium]|nr:FecR domain-containing protein [Alphaproteobacteria bacterium]